LVPDKVGFEIGGRLTKAIHGAWKSPFVCTKIRG